MLDFDAQRSNCLRLFDKFSLGNSAKEMIGHALALQIDDSYLNAPALETITKIQLYKRSVLRFGKSPYIYPAYGLCELPQGFARLSAIYGGTYMLGKKFDGLIYDEVSGKVSGVKSGDEVARCKGVIGDPSYFPEKVKTIGRVIRAICLLKAPIPKTNNADSLQLIIPRSQVNRNYGILLCVTFICLLLDIYIACTSSQHKISPDGIYIAIVSTIVETEYPELEIKPGLDLLGIILER